MNTCHEKSFIQTLKIIVFDAVYMYIWPLGNSLNAIVKMLAYISIDILLEDKHFVTLQ